MLPRMRVGVHRTRARWLGLLSAVIACALAAPVAAQAALDWSVEGCAQLPTAEVARLLELELVTQGQWDLASEDRPSVALRCRGLEAGVSVARGAGLEPLELELNLAESKPEARARVLALAIAELIATSRLERVEAAAASAPTAPEPSSSPRRAPVRLGLFAQGGAARVLQPAVIAPVFALGAVQRLAAFSLEVDVALGLARLQTDRALVHARELTVSLAPGWHLTGGRLDLGLALGVRAGHVQLSARARETGQRGLELSGWTLLPVARVSLEIALMRVLGARLDVEAGYVIKPLQGEDADGLSLAAVRGVRVAALLGLILWLDAL